MISGDSEHLIKDSNSSNRIILPHSSYCLKAATSGGNIFNIPYQGLITTTEGVKDISVKRRNLLRILGTAGTVSLAGCTNMLNPKTPNTEEPSTKTGTETPTETETETETETTDPLEQTHSADNLDSVVQELEQNSVALNLQPVDENADYVNSNIFNEYSSTGENVLDVEIDLNQAEQQRHHNQKSINHSAVQEFKNNIEDPEWRTQILEEAEVNNPQNWVDWDKYTDESLSYEERMKQSDLWRLWYEFEDLRFGGVSSANNQYKAQALQETETQQGFDTFIWDYGIPGHGLISAIEHPTRNQENTENQETYIVETDFTDAESQQISTWENSQYQNTELHPAREGVDRETTKLGFYSRTAIGKDEGGFHETVDIPMEEIEQFIDFFRNPQSNPAYDHLDPMTATAYIAEENIYNGELEGEVELGTNTIEIQV